MRWGMLFGAAAILWACQSEAPPPAASVAPKEPLPARVIHMVDTGVPPTTVPNAGLRIDLYLPEQDPAAEPAPLLLYAVGGVWGMPDVGYVRAASMGDAMQRMGVATAVVRFALADDYRLAPCLEHLAHSLKGLLALGERHGFRSDRLVLGGYEVGGLLMANLALGDALAKAGVTTHVAGVVAMRSVFDLAPDVIEGHPQQEFLTWAAGPEPSRRSPIALVGPKAPKFLVLNGGEDLPGYPQRGRAFVRALERAGATGSLDVVVPERDGDSLANVSGEGNRVGAFIASFVHGDPSPGHIDSPFGVKERWSRAPPLSTEPFWANPKLVREFPTNGGFRWMLQRIFEKQMFELNPWPGKTYHALDLLEYLDSRNDVGEGKYLVITNLRDERLVFHRRDLKRYKAQLVVGMDDERNLYRVFAAYRMDHLYSWEPKPDYLPVMIRPAGAFLHFPKDIPKRLWNGSYASFGLSPGSFRWHREDPLGGVRGLPKNLREVLAGASGCLTCHTYKGMGTRSHHVKAEDAKPFGAYALGLEEYPSKVLSDFLFDQERVAGLFGVKPLMVDSNDAEALLALVEKARGPNPKPPVLGPLPGTQADDSY